MYQETKLNVNLYYCKKLVKPLPSEWTVVVCENLVSFHFDTFSWPIRMEPPLVGHLGKPMPLVIYCSNLQGRRHTTRETDLIYVHSGSKESANEEMNAPTG